MISLVVIVLSTAVIVGFGVLVISLRIAGIEKAFGSRLDATSNYHDAMDKRYADALAAFEGVTDLRNREYDHFNKKLQRILSALAPPSDPSEIDTDPTQSIRVPGTRGPGTAGE